MIAKPQQDKTRKEIASGIIVFRKTSEGPRFLILYHGHGYWNFPKGKLEKEEKSFAAALRETREETGLAQTDLRFIGFFRTYENYSFFQGGQKVFKTVTFYLAESLISNIHLSSEHKGYGWFTYKEAINVFKGKKAQDSLRILRRAYNFMRNRSLKRKKTVK